MTRPKQSDGVQATIERLTGRIPCPDHLRNCLNKYLYEPDLFEGAYKPKGGGRKRQGRLKYGFTDNLVTNLLDLDAVFLGSTDLVSRIVQKKVQGDELRVELDKAQRNIQQRLDSYAFWARRMESLKDALLAGDIDLKTDNLLERLDAKCQSSSSQAAARFGLRAVQELERIETRGRPGALTSKELTELADAYLALGDLARASEKARDALEADITYARAWFIRVVVALRLRNAAIREMQQQEMVAAEIAEPMSAHERLARELAGEASDRAHCLNEKLDGILPQAILHWPKTNGWRYEHEEQRKVVRDLFIDQTFLRVTQGAGSLDHARLQEMNGFGPEEAFERRTYTFLPTSPIASESCLPVSSADQEALALIIAEKDKHPFWFFDIADRKQTLRDLKLLHLRWLFNLGGYEQHWCSLAENISRHPELHLTNDILRDRVAARVWHMHHCLNSGVESVTTILDLWRANNVAQMQADCGITQLNQLSLLFHRQFVREEYLSCYMIARTALEVANEEVAKTDHPTDDCTLVPSGAWLYWRYLEALSVSARPTRLDAAIQPFDGCQRWGRSSAMRL